jgi:hypothetical protein
MIIIDLIHSHLIFPPAFFGNPKPTARALRSDFVDPLLRFRRLWLRLFCRGARAQCSIHYISATYRPVRARTDVRLDSIESSIVCILIHNTVGSFLVGSYI